MNVPTSQSSQTNDPLLRWYWPAWQNAQNVEPILNQHNMSYSDTLYHTVMFMLKGGWLLPKLDSLEPEGHEVQIAWPEIAAYVDGWHCEHDCGPEPDTGIL